MIKGMDVSAWQGNVNWARAAKSGVRFTYIKVSQRLYADKLFHQNWPSARAAGVLRGGYHYLVWDRDPLEQAETFCTLLKDDPGELPPAADFEERGGVPVDAADRLKRFLNAVEYHLDVKPAIYTSPDFWKNHGSTDPVWTEYPLWIANYQVNQPHIPAPWTDYAFWQHTNGGDGSYYGCTSRGVDMNLCADETFARYATVGLHPATSTPAQQKTLCGTDASSVTSIPAQHKTLCGTDASSVTSTSSVTGVASSSAQSATLQDKVDRLWRAHPTLWPLP